MSTIALLPGDGIGAEILDGPVEFLRRLAALGHPVTLTDPQPYGTTGWLQTGSTLPPQTVEACQNADVILSGAVGTHPGVLAVDCPHPEAALITLRHTFELRVSVRTVWAPDGGDVTIVRNITDGAYVTDEYRVESDGDRVAVDQIRLDPVRVREIMELAASYARLSPGRRHVSVDKPSVFATSRLWRRIASQVALESGVSFEHLNVDRAAYELAKHPELPAVIAAEGIFGDILSDLVGARMGSPALCGSATINPDRTFGHGANGLFEPAHGSSPHRTGTRRSNPTGAWLALAALLDWCPDLTSVGAAADIRGALTRVYAGGALTYDMATPERVRVVDLDAFNDLVLKELTNNLKQGEDNGAVEASR